MLAVTKDDPDLAEEALGMPAADVDATVRRVYNSPNEFAKKGFTKYFYGPDTKDKLSGENNSTELHRVDGLDEHQTVCSLLGVFCQFVLDYKGTQPSKMEYCHGDTALHICVRNGKARVVLLDR